MPPRGSGSTTTSLQKSPYKHTGHKEGRKLDVTARIWAV